MSETNTSAPQDDASEPTTTQKVGAFDIRNFIGALIGLYGIILLILGLVAFNDMESARTGGINANLWAGIGMIVVAVIFLLWARLEPLKVEVPLDIAEDPEPGE